MRNKVMFALFLVLSVLMVSQSAPGKDGSFIDEDEVVAALGGPLESAVDQRGQDKQSKDCDPPKFRSIQMGSAGVPRQDPKLKASIVPKKLDLHGIQFGYNSSEILPESYTQLDAVGRALLRIQNQCGNAQVEIVGHTCDRGSSRYNLRLSMKRAEAVRLYLVEHFTGIPAGALTAKGQGKNRPLVKNVDESSRMQNRRVEFVRTR
jgi:outer membrane protein OmpA-like peptidoglycan-associated protein